MLISRWKVKKRLVTQCLQKQSDNTQLAVEYGLNWHKGQIAYLKVSHGVPEDPDVKPFSPFASVGITDDAAVARWVYEVPLAVWRRNRCLWYGKGIATLSGGLKAGRRGVVCWNF